MNFKGMASKMGGDAVNAASGAAVGSAAGALSEHTGVELSEEQTAAL